jgi:ParB family chromosome partitioning protein
VTTVAPSPSSSPTARTLTRWLTPDFVVDPGQPRKTFDEAALDELARNLKERGQLVPLITYRDPTNDRRLVIVDGERRWRAALRGMIPELDVIVLPAKPSAAELLLAQLSVNQFRANLTAREQRDAYRTLLDELHLTQTELAARLGVSPSTVNKALARDRLAPALHEFADRLEPAVLPLLTPLPADEQQAAVAFAITPTEAGQLPTRDQVAAFLTARKRAPSRRRAKPLAGVIGGRAFRLALTSGDTHDTLIEAFKQLIQFVQKNRNVPVPNLALLARA